jgi:hypothetical protein
MEYTSSSRDVPDMVNFSFLRFFDKIKRIGGILALIGLLFGSWTGSTMAQSYRDSDSRFGSDRLEKQSRDRQHSSSSNLPDWAEPSAEQPRDLRGDSSPQSADAKANAAPPDPPDNPSRIPVDGGIALLAAAGAGYAVRKLNEDDDDEEPA